MKKLILKIKTCGDCPYLTFPMEDLFKYNNNFKCSFDEKNIIIFSKFDSVDSIPKWCQLKDFT